MDISTGQTLLHSTHGRLRWTISASVQPKPFNCFNPPPHWLKRINGHPNIGDFAMNPSELVQVRLECLRLAQGDVDRARQILAFVTGSSDAAEYEKNAGYPADDGKSVAKAA